MRALAAVVIALALVPAAGADTFALELAAPAPATHGDAVVLRGKTVPTLVDAPVTLHRDGAVVATTTTGSDGTFRFRVVADAPAAYLARAGQLESPAATLHVRPRIRARLVGAGVVGRRLRLEASVAPARSFHVQIRRNGKVVVERDILGSARIGLGTRRAASLRVTVSVAEADGWSAASRTLRAAVVQPLLALGARGPSVRVVEQRLRELRYALPRVDGLYGLDTYQAVLAFQKVERLPWTGRVDARVWARLRSARVPRARFAGNHIEVSKGRQFLMVVRNGVVSDVVHVSTGATGNTPLGRWQVYRKVSGWDWVLWYPMYFLRGFAIHGYPSVPAYPASHGCVRVPMWIAPRLYSSHGWGTTVHVYW